MQIQILDLVEGAKKATGLTVIIDVFRAFSLDCYLFNNGAEKIIPVGDIDLAYQLKKDNPDYVLIGERNEQMPSGFDFGNSPSHILNENFSGKTIVHTTSAGTQGMIHARNADEVITGSFVNANAIVSYIKKKAPEEVSLVAMGYSALHLVEEDTACAEYIKYGLEGNYYDFNAATAFIRKTSGARFFLPEKQHYAPQEDFGLCLNLNRFNFVLKRYYENDHLVLKKIDI